MRLVQLRNPWGKLGWRGDWSEGSALWSAPLRRRLHHLTRNPNPNPNPNPDSNPEPGPPDPDPDPNPDLNPDSDPSLRRRLQPHGAGEGTFWMCWRDFCRFFSAVDVCRHRPRPHPTLTLTLLLTLTLTRTLLLLLQVWHRAEEPPLRATALHLVRHEG